MLSIALLGLSILFSGGHLVVKRGWLVVAANLKLNRVGPVKPISLAVQEPRQADAYFAFTS